MANKALESTVLAIEVQSAIDKDGNPTFTKKKIGNLVLNSKKVSTWMKTYKVVVNSTN